MDKYQLLNQIKHIILIHCLILVICRFILTDCAQEVMDDGTYANLFQLVHLQNTVTMLLPAF